MNCRSQPASGYNNIDTVGARTRNIPVRWCKNVKNDQRLFKQHLPSKHPIQFELSVLLLSLALFLVINIHAHAGQLNSFTHWRADYWYSWLFALWLDVFCLVRNLLPAQVLALLFVNFEVSVVFPPSVLSWVWLTVVFHTCMVSLRSGSVLPGQGHECAEHRGDDRCSYPPLG